MINFELSIEEITDIYTKIMLWRQMNLNCDKLWYNDKKEEMIECIHDTLFYYRDKLSQFNSTIKYVNYSYEDHDYSTTHEYVFAIDDCFYLLSIGESSYNGFGYKYADLYKVKPVEVTTIEYKIITTINHEEVFKPN